MGNPISLAYSGRVTARVRARVEALVILRNANREDRQLAVVLVVVM